MKLYFAPGACSLSPHIVLREAGLTFDLESVDLKAKKLKNGADYYQINPKGQVPLLALDNGEMLTEGPAIVQYIADIAPASGLVPPAGSKERYRAQEWLNFISSELHKNFSPLFRPNTPEDYKSIAKENLANRFAYVDKHLSNRPYLVGDKFTVADAYLFTILNWAKFQSIDLAPWPNLLKFMSRVGERPKVKEALRAEGLA
jgi:glutathione S-transferase